MSAAGSDSSNDCGNCGTGKYAAAGASCGVVYRIGLLEAAGPEAAGPLSKRSSAAESTNSANWRMPLEIASLALPEEVKCVVVWWGGVRCVVCGVVVCGVWWCGVWCVA